MRHLFTLILFTVVAGAASQHAVAQVNLDGPGAGETTLDGLGGLTTEGLDAGAGLEDAFSGSEDGFVGAPPEDEFVGAGEEPTDNNRVNRLFRAITGADVPTGTTQETTGNRRRVPVSLRLGFPAPSPRQATALAGPDQVALKRYLAIRPELLAVAVSMDDAGVVTLSGTVADASTGRLAANLVRLQPGVRKIRNQLVVEPAAAEVQ